MKFRLCYAIEFINAGNLFENDLGGLKCSLDFPYDKYEEQDKRLETIDSVLYGYGWGPKWIIDKWIIPKRAGAVR